uniref:Uncharacterized protein n=1 Tax=Apteryx owenii TaxID=8824 RepID=A0A8B9SAQ6_APTOW
MQTSGLKESCSVVGVQGAEPGGSRLVSGGGRLAVVPLTSPRLYFMLLQLVDLHLGALPAARLPRAALPRSLTHEALLLAVPQRGGPHTVGDQREESLLHLQPGTRKDIRGGTRRPAGEPGPRNHPGPSGR